MDVFPRLTSQRISAALREPVTPYPVQLIESQWTQRWYRARQVIAILPFIGLIFTLVNTLTVNPTSALGTIGRMISFITLVGIGLFLSALLIGLPYAVRAVRISAQISIARERRTYDLLSVSRLGKYGLHWWIARHFSVPVKPTSLIRQFPKLFVSLFIVVGLCGLLVFVPLFRVYPLEALRGLAYLVTGIYAILLYLRQSNAAATLLGALVPDYVESRAEVQFWSLSSYVLFQIVTIGLFVMVGFLLLPSRADFNAGPGVEDLLALLLLFALLIAPRELIVVWMWRHLRWRLNGYDEELDLVSRIAL